MENRIIFHCDVNSAYLSWQAAYSLQKGKPDLREVPSVIGGSEEKRLGVVLAKSTPAKRYGIKTGESLYSARKKCRNLIVVPPDYRLYEKCSNAMIKVFKEYTPLVEKFSIDECFLDFAGMKYIYNDYLKLAHEIKDRIKAELGFTINIGISSNKLLAKMASDFQKPNMVHTLWKHEIQDKMWPLPVRELFMVGVSTAKKLKQYNINTIGDLANSNLEDIRYRLKKPGVQIWKYANGIEDAPVNSIPSDAKCIGNSTTIAFDVNDRETAHKILLSLTETVGARLRATGNACSTVSINIKDNSFYSYSRQRKIDLPIDTTSEILTEVYKLFDANWSGNPIRQLGVQVSELCSSRTYQVSIFEDKKTLKHKKLDKVIDELREKYGNDAVIRSTFLKTNINHIFVKGEEEHNNG